MQESTQQFSISTAIPGRIRLKIPDLYRNTLLSNSLMKGLEKINGIKSLKINTATKSLLVEYLSQQISESKIIDEIKKELQQYKRILHQKMDMVMSTATTTVVPLHAGHRAPIQKSSKNNFKSSRKSPKGLDFPPPLNNTEWYKKSAKEIKRILTTDFNTGISEEQWRELIKKYGPNEFQQQEKKSIFRMFLEQFDDFIMKLLLGASAVTYFIGQRGDTFTILAVIVVEALLGVWQNRKAQKSLEALKNYAAPSSRVIRSGQVQQVASRDLVPGDIILFEAGDILPADARIIESFNLEVQESTLTGESEAVSKSAKVEHSTTIPLGDIKNMVFMGTTVVRGNGRAIVVNTGMSTEMGAIAKVLDSDHEEPTPLQRDLMNMAKIITWICIGVSATIVISGILGGQSFVEMLRTGIGLTVGAIPEGLTTILTISLAFGAQRMAKRGAIVKNLPSVESLSCADVICTDKTGTLTLGQMTVTDLATINNCYKVSGDNNPLKGNFYSGNHKIHPNQYPDLKQLVTIGGLCNNSSYQINDDKSLEIIGDPTEAALLILAEKAAFDGKHFDCFTKLKEYSFDSELKRMSVICKDQLGKHNINIKGAPDVILKRCTKILDGSTVREITPEDIIQLESRINRMTQEALRVLAFAYKDIPSIPTTPKEEELVEKELIFVGLAGMIDPPRPEVKDAITKCHKAGIRVVMITGDHRNTAIAIGNQLRLFNKGKQVITGEQLDSYSDEELRDVIDDVVIFARTSPHQKLRIVKAFRNKGHIVAMTGDGVNDAPAIKESDIGIAMGKNGSDVTKDSAGIILTDDNFTTIVKAIEEGRGISSNIKKFIRYVLSGNVGEVMAIFTASIFRLPPPLLAGQILMINLVTEGIPALALGVDPPNDYIMEEAPRDPSCSVFDRPLLSKILTRGLLMGLAAFGLFAGTYRLTGNIIKARTLAYGSIVVSQMLHVFECRGKSKTKNKYIVPSVAISTLLFLGSIYIPTFAGLFGTAPLGMLDWLILLVMAELVKIGDHLKQLITRTLDCSAFQPSPSY
ncbi:cation-translocating P-type ATPase [Alkaliphilus hydrothermalis]|uniref:Ca2+-transporting ATPase n=1 Tax=Alkaliphilus hydrothermalis TaxID=1482730 RepID=A0ABS2NND7_9FIRM|nr:HAD-IC family P-type ATPase [Alkaliphilus hydrothermalis]MBM7614448.1 Ca2+-transporting ATPase [Alkaliphilus hydrothermalis]